MGFQNGLQRRIGRVLASVPSRGGTSVGSRCYSGLSICGVGLTVEDLWFRVQGSGFRVRNSGFRTCRLGWYAPPTSI